MTTGTPSPDAGKHPAHLRLPVLALTALIGGLLVRFACLAIPLPDWLPPLLALVPLLILVSPRLTDPNGAVTIRDELMRGWSLCTDWLATISWWRLFFFGIFCLITADALGTALFGTFNPGKAVLGLLFGLCATWVAVRADGMRPPASPALRQLASFGWKRMCVLGLLIALIGAMLSSFVSRDAARSNPVIKVVTKDGKEKHIELPGARIKVDEDQVSINGKHSIISFDSHGIRLLEKKQDGSAVEKSKLGENPDAKAEAGSGSAPANTAQPDTETLAPASPDASGIPAIPPDAASAAAGAASEDEEDDSDQDVASDMQLERRAAFDYGTLALVGVLGLVAIKLLAGGKRRAEEEADSARNDADLARLQREVADAKLAAMQAQIEPHFLFNTLASIEQLIRSEPERAAQVQKSLITYLRGAIPEIRDDAQRSTLGRQLDMSRAYLSIMQVRMEERLHWEIRVSEGLRGAEFPSMMLQTLIENSIKHGLEPLAEGGSLFVDAEVGRNRLIVRVEDSGRGCQEGEVPQGTGLANIRERLRLLYGAQAAFSLSAREGGGCIARIELPYRDETPTTPERG